MIGSFALNGKTINIKADYNNVDGRFYRFIQADTQKEVAVTSYRGIDLAEGVQYTKAELQRGLESVRRKTRR
jgi:hypothetical protein